MAQSKLPAFQFYPADWRKDPGVQSLTYFDRGVWFEILCLMHESEQRGKLLLNGKPMPNEVLARLLGLDKQLLVKTLSTLIEFGVATQDENGMLINRRMIRDEERRQISRDFGHQGGNPSLKAGYNAPGFVYAIRRASDNAVKIGIAVNVTNRFNKIRYSDKSDTFTLLATMPTTDMGTTEAALHTRYEKYRVIGEWFNLPPNILTELLTHMGKTGVGDKGKERASSSSSSSDLEHTHNASDWAYPVKELLEAFPNLVLTPTMVGFIEGEVGPGDEIAWANTLKTYRMNYDPANNRYLPEKTGNLLGVFRSEKGKLEKAKNGSTRQPGKSNLGALEQSADYFESKYGPA